MSDETKDPTASAAEPESVLAETEVDDGLPANKITIEETGQARKKITIEVDHQRIDAKFNEIFGELRGSAQVPGFRIGRAPRRLLERRFGKEAGEDVRNSLVSESLAAAVEEHKINVLGEPDIKLDEIELPDTGSLVFSVEVEVTPEFDLPDYKAIAVQEPSTEVTEERLEAATRQILAARGTLAPTQEPVIEGDLVIADVAVAGDGIDERHENMELRVAPAAVDGIPLEEMGDKLTGSAAGKTVKFKTVVPAGHAEEAWREKTVTVTVDLKEVKRLDVPELTDELAEDYGFDDVGALKQYVSDNLGAQLGRERQQGMRDQICRYLLEKTEMALPEGVSARHTAKTLQRRYVELLYRGVPKDEIEQNMSMLEAQATEQAKIDLKLTFILEKIAEAEGISVAEGETNARIAEMAGRQGRRPERLRSEMASQGTLDQVEIQVREQKAIDKLLEMAEITQPAPAPAAKATPKKAKAKGGSKKAAKKSKKSSPKKDDAKS